MFAPTGKLNTDTADSRLVYNAAKGAAKLYVDIVDSYYRYKGIFFEAAQPNIRTGTSKERHWWKRPMA